MSSSTRAACVIGYPAKQSRSPKLHGYWLAKYGINGEYRIEEIPTQDVEEFILNLRDRGYVGANVTMPHKDIAFRLSEPDDKAMMIGAANTLWLDGNRLRSTNTDGDGFVGSLDAAAPGWASDLTDAVVLGAGGAARSIVYALLARDVTNIHVVNRTIEKAEVLRERFGAAVQPAGWEDVPRLLAGAGLLVNATSLGMHGQPKLSIDLSPLRDRALVSDIVNVPLKTGLLADAEKRGLTTTNGLQMLLHQAVRGFELWFGLTPRVTQEQYDLIAADMIAG